MMKEQILAAYEFRHAAKGFDAAKKITDEDFQTILETGRLSPSSFGFELWQFLVIQNPALRERILPIACGQKQITSASHLVITLYRRGEDLVPGSEYLLSFMREVQQLPEEIVKMKGDFYAFFQNELFKLAGDEVKVSEWSARQTYLPMANMMTTAAMLGIDSCPIEGFNKDDLEALLASEAGVDITKFGVAHITAYGYRATEPTREKTRRTQEDVVRWI